MHPDWLLAPDKPYNGALSFGISGDYDTTADIGVLAAGIEAGLADLVAAAHD